MTISIRTNVNALNSRNFLDKASKKRDAALGHLASGSRINNAGDDAAGLQISSRLSSQQSGLSVAADNANQGISIAQTAEGGMEEMSDLLQRMRELALQSANGSNTQSERQSLQKEVSQLKDQMNRIAETTSFGERKLLNGTYGTRSFQVGSHNGTTIELSLNNMRADQPPMGGKTFRAETKTAASWRVTPNNNQLTVSIKNKAGDEQHINIKANVGDDIQELATYINGQTNEVKASVDGQGRLQFFADHSSGDKSIEFGGSLASQLKIHSDKEMTVNDVNIATIGGSQEAVGVLDSAIKYVDSQRAYLGALQNRFQSTINTLNKSSEDIASSNSRIKDTDYAKETTEMTKQQILSKASTAVLAQAKQVPTTALNLLK